MSPKWLARRSSSAISAAQPRARAAAPRRRAPPRRRARRRTRRRRCCRRRCGRRAAPRWRVGAGHQAVDALVDVAEPLLEAHDRLAVGGEAEMAGLDDAGMDRPDRNLVQALALGGRNAIGRRSLRRAGVRAAERLRARPSGRGRATAALSGDAVRLEPEEIADRPLEADRRRMRRADRGKAPVRTVEAERPRCAAPLVEQRHVDGAGSPHRPSERPARPRPARPIASRQPSASTRRRAATAGGRRPAGRLPISESSSAPSSLSEQPRDVLEPGDQRRRQVDAGGEAPARNARTSARRTP